MRAPRIHSMMFYELLSWANRLDAAWIDYENSTSGPDDDNGRIARAAADRITELEDDIEYWRERHNAAKRTVKALYMLAKIVAEDLRVALSELETEKASETLIHWDAYMKRIDQVLEGM